MFYTVYKVTNLINGKIYIGVHKTKNPNDDYMGSGKVLIRAQNKYGIENFEKEILEVFDNPEEMFEMESKLVNEDFVNRKDTYNLKEGGFGGFDYLNTTGLNTKNHNYVDMALKGGAVTKFKCENDEAFRKKNLEQLKNANKKALIKLKEMYKSGELKGKPHSEKTKKKLSSLRKGKYKGVDNSQYGTMWVYNTKLKKSKKIPKTELNQWIDKGWIQGRKLIFDKKKKIKLCKKCGSEKCLRPDICSKHQMVRTFIELFGFNENMLGSKQFYEEYDRIVKMLNDEYHIEKKSTIDLAKKYNISTQRVDSIFKSIGIKPRTLSEANSNAAKRRKKYMRV